MLWRKTLVATIVKDVRKVDQKLTVVLERNGRIIDDQYLLQRRYSMGPHIPRCGFAQQLFKEALVSSRWLPWEVRLGTDDEV